MAKLSELSISSLSFIHQIRYTDLVKVYRTTEEVVDGFTKHGTYKEIATYPCKLSFGENDDSTHELPDLVTGYLPMKVFVANNTDIIKGDKLVVLRLEDNASGRIVQEYRGIANKPTGLRSHLEISFVDDSVG